MEFRLGKAEDLPQIEQIIADAVELMRESGLDQWQKGYPNIDIIRDDQQKHVNYVLAEEGKVLGVVMVQTWGEVSYNQIDGAWLNDEPYGSLHRVCVAKDQKGKGIAGHLFAEGIKILRAKGFKNVRIDTHKDNVRMRHALEKAGFSYCGTIQLVGGPEDGGLRVGYQYTA